MSAMAPFTPSNRDAWRRPPCLPWWKRAIDLACCVAALPLLAVCTLVAALLMRLTSPGPIFFRQERVGHQGRRFLLFKFRTMHVGASTATHQAHFTELMRNNTPMQKLDRAGDSRLIAGGWLLRASGLDELPQILNVLRGDMSIVGPRPCIPYEFEQYTPEQRRRLDCLPGLTGLWQVSGKNRLSFAEMITLDVAYSRQITFWQDLRIILFTVPALVVQILDTKRGRRSSAATAVSKSAAPFAVPEEPVLPLNAKRQPEFQRP
ncbi:MAG: sugar transferase [Verrucomicrobia bacterium]|nr:sugar transferase [Verrucomicrobiota bacterium]